MSLWWVIVFALVAFAACVDQLIRTHRYVAAFEELTATTEVLVEDPHADLGPTAAVMARVRVLHKADRRAVRVYVVAGAVVIVVGLVLS